MIINKKIKSKTLRLFILNTVLISSLLNNQSFAVETNNLLNDKDISTTNIKSISLDKKLYEMNEKEIDSFLKSIKNKSLVERIEIISKNSLGTKYRLDPLGEANYDKFDKDPLFNFKEVDCVTFCEQTLSLSISNDFKSFFDNLQKIRYKNGNIKMSERNHFFMADWVVNNSGLVQDVTSIVYKEAKPLTKTISTKKLLEKYNLTDLNEDREMTINYIPKDKMSLIKNNLKTGDILVYIQKMPGIFASHTGLIIKKDKQILFRNATSLQPKEVIDVDFDKLSAYLLKSEKNLGISILRLNDNI